MDLKYNNIEELYELLSPALETKKIQLKINDYLGISKKDIWDYLIKTTWKDNSNMRIYELVSDILNIKGEEINNYKEM